MPKMIIADDQEDVRKPYVRLIGKLYDVDIEEVSNGRDLVDRIRSAVDVLWEIYASRRYTGFPKMWIHQLQDHD